MGISVMQQLEAFAFWRQQLLATPSGQELWGLPEALETKLMNQAPLYALGEERLDFYLEAPLVGQPQVDLSAQYFAEAFAERNQLEGLEVEQEGAFFHYYANELARLKPALLHNGNLYLEADIADEGEPKVASFINLSGDFVEELLQTKAYSDFSELLQNNKLADSRIQGLVNSVIAASSSADTYIYSRISHFKLRWQAGEALPAKIYLQMRPIRRQSCVNEALGYEKLEFKRGK